MLITPETMFLYSDGDVCFGQGVAETSYTAPELLVNDTSVPLEKVSMRACVLCNSIVWMRACVLCNSIVWMRA